MVETIFDIVYNYRDLPKHAAILALNLMQEHNNGVEEVVEAL